MKTVFQLADALSAAETRYIALGLAAASLTVLVDDAANVEASVSNAAAPGASSLWSALAMTDNSGCTTGPVTGVKLVANASGGSFSILAMHDR